MLTDSEKQTLDQYLAQLYVVTKSEQDPRK